MKHSFPKDVHPAVQDIVNRLWANTPDDNRFWLPPVGWRRVDDADFCLSKFFGERPAYTVDLNSVQDRSPETVERFHSPHGHWFHGTYDHYWDGTGTHIAPVYVSKDGKYHVEFYRFGCDHKYEHTAKLGNCYNRYTCSVCGQVKDVDSSD